MSSIIGWILVTDIVQNLIIVQSDFYTEPNMFCCILGTDLSHLFKMSIVVVVLTRK